MPRASGPLNATPGSQFMDVLLFEDAFVTRLHPITLCRPAYAISCGGLRLVDIVSKLDLSVAGAVRSYLAEIQRQDFPHLVRRTSAASRIVINARLAPNVAMLSTVRRIIAAQKSGAVWRDGQLVLAVLPDDLSAPDDLSGPEVPSFVREASLPKMELSADDNSVLALLNYPHSVIAQHRAMFTANLEYRISAEQFQEITPGVFAKPGATLGQYVVSDTSCGPILLEADSVVGPFCCLSGPLQVGANSLIHAHTTIHPFVDLGYTVKVGGELDTCVLEAYSNKQHYGYLGHSYLGSWINLGAGTTNSNLKNTYGEVNVVHDGQKISTGMRLMGCVIGDYSKTAINTAILTGKRIGAGSMIYGFVTRNVPSFVNYAQQFGDTTTVSIDVAISTQQRMFARRQVPHRPCDEQLLRDVFEMTRDSRTEFACRPPKLG